MVVAYLRGLLKPSLHYGLRSLVAENYIFESLLADNQAQMLESSIQSDASILPALKMDSKRDTMRLINRRRQRCMEIRNGAIYGIKKERTPGQISLYQLYHLCSRAGILETLTKGKPINNDG